ncbi:hypothetical protein EDD11_005167 [Mortierella claussenii]|nr:hypothetical protein EDD11_005167 [Mortierella claussenii]
MDSTANEMVMQGMPMLLEWDVGDIRHLSTEGRRQNKQSGLENDCSLQKPSCVGAATSAEAEELPVSAQTRPPRQHALSIPEIMLMIIAHLSCTDILFCRGVSRQWRKLFSPFLQLHAIYWNHGQAIYQRKFEDRLDTLGQFVQSLKQVYPIPGHLQRIQRTCSNLTHIGFFLRDRDMLSTECMIRFLRDMPQLERIDIFSHHDQLVSALLFCLSTYQSPSSSLTPSPTCTSQLKTLDIGNAAHSITFPSMPWTLLENMLAVHPQLQELVLREGQLKERPELKMERALGWVHTLVTKKILGQAQRKLNGIFNRTPQGGGAAETGEEGQDEQSGSASMLLGSRPRSRSTSSLGTQPPQVLFSHLKRLVFEDIQLSEELFVSILSRCPALETLELKLTGVYLSSQVWSRLLPQCPQLSSISINNSYSTVTMDIAEFWALAPSTLKSFRVSHAHSTDMFFTAVEGAIAQLDLPVRRRRRRIYGNNSSSSTNDSHPSSPRFQPPGSMLVCLELGARLLIRDRGLCYIMASCPSLQKLVLELQYFTEWGQGTDDNHIGHSRNVFPEWACGRSLRTLELRAVYMPFDQEFDQRTHAFMARLADLVALQMFILPVKLLSDLSESQREEYSAFRALLDQLDQETLLEDQQQAAQLASIMSSLTLQSSSTAATPASVSSSTPLPENPGPGTLSLPTMDPPQTQLRLSSRKRWTWSRDGSGPKNVVPQLLSVREVILTSPATIRFPIQMRSLHILMEALPGLKTIWTQTALYEIDWVSKFKHIHNHFQDFYAATGVQLNLGLPQD